MNKMAALKVEGKDFLPEWQGNEAKDKSNWGQKRKRKNGGEKQMTQHKWGQKTQNFEKRVHYITL